MIEKIVGILHDRIDKMDGKISAEQNKFATSSEWVKFYSELAKGYRGALKIVENSKTFDDAQAEIQREIKSLEPSFYRNAYNNTDVLMWDLS